MFDEIRPLTQTDLVEIESLFSRANQYVIARSLSDYWLYATLFSDTCLVAIANQKVVGTVFAFINQTKPDELYIQDLLVAGEARNQGIGLALMQTLITKANAHNIKRIWLTSAMDNKPAMALWEKLGFMNLEADYLEDGYWVTKNLKGPEKDRVIFEYLI